MKLIWIQFEQSQLWVCGYLILILFILQLVVTYVPLEKAMEKKKRIHPSTSDAKFEETAEVIPDTFDQVLTDITRNYKHQAPVELPNSEDLTVRLVKIDLIEKLLEAKEDFEMYLSIMFAFVGTLLGAVLSYILQGDFEEVPKLFIVVGIILVIIIIFLFIRMLVVYNRYKKVKTKIFQGYGKTTG